MKNKENGECGWRDPLANQTPKHCGENSPSSSQTE